MIKKRVILIILILLCISLNACSLASNDTQDEFNETELFIPDESLIKEHEKLMFILEGNASYYYKTGPFEDITVVPPMDRLNEKLSVELNTEIEFHWIFKGVDHYYQNEISTLYNSGIHFDAFTFHKIEPFVSNGIAMDITDYIKNNVKYLYQYFNYDEITNSPYISKNQRVYAIPAVFDSTAYRYGSYSILLPAADKKFFNDSLFTNEDEMSNYLISVKNKETEATGLTSSLEYVDFCVKDLSAITHQYSELFLLDDSLNVTWLCDTPYFTDIIQTYFTDIYNKEEYKRKETGVKLCNYRELHVPTYRRPNNENILVNKECVFDYLVMKDINVPIKKYPGYSKLAFDVKTNDIENIYGSTIGDMMIISNSCKHPERVMLFLDWLYSDKGNYEMLRYGIQDANFYKDDQDSVYFDLSNNVIYDWAGSAFFVNPLLDSYNVQGYSEHDRLYNRKYTDIQQKVLTGEKLMRVPSEDELLDFQSITKFYSNAFFNMVDKICSTGNIRLSIDEYQSLFNENDRNALEEFIKEYDVYFLENYGISFRTNNE